jgi:glycosyltransferase involved in cell wall biosynthesis
MQNIKLSIITVTLNSEKYLEDTIQSVINQGYINFEYFIIDGGSNDSTIEIIKKYEKYLSGWISEPDNGMYDAINKGIAKSSGEIIGIINSDDYYFPNAFDKVIKAFENKPLDQYIFWGDVLYEDGQIAGWRERNLKLGAFAPHPSMFCPRSVYDRVGMYSIDFKLLGDYDFMYRAIHSYGIKPLYLPEQIAFFRGGGMASRDILRSLTDELHVKLRYGQSPFVAVLVFCLKIIKNCIKILNNICTS